ncbi:MAG TPA: hypothetical protein VM890_12320 [Longimicrobium sp.]|jgi:hypothetical protein|nr:hypothetical protein [Longimicrobium sp.]
MSDFDIPAGSGTADAQGRGGHGHGHDHGDGGHGHGHGGSHGHEHGHPSPAPRYLRAFKRLVRGKPAIVEHGMDTFPLVDVYELKPFDVAASADETSDVASVRFYLMHDSDRIARVRDGRTVTIPHDPRSSISLESALRMLGVRYDDDRHLGDVVGALWDALFSPPSDPFDETSYANSPWLDRDTGDRRTVGDLRHGGPWDNLWLVMRPRKLLDAGTAGPLAGVEVVQLGLDAVGLGLHEKAEQPEMTVMVLLRA